MVSAWRVVGRYERHQEIAAVSQDVRRQHADHGECTVLGYESLPDDIWVERKVASPVSMREEHDMVVAGPLVVWHERVTENRLDAKCRQPRARHLRAVD